MIRPHEGHLQADTHPHVSNVRIVGGKHGASQLPGPLCRFGGIRQQWLSEHQRDVLAWDSPRPSTRWYDAQYSHLPALRSLLNVASAPRQTAYDPRRSRGHKATQVPDALATARP